MARARMPQVSPLERFWAAFRAAFKLHAGAGPAHGSLLQRLLSKAGLAEHLLGYIPLPSLLTVGLACRELRSLVDNLPEAVLARSAAAEFPAGHPARTVTPLLPYLRAQHRLRTALVDGGRHTLHRLAFEVERDGVAPNCSCAAMVDGNRLDIRSLPSGQPLHSFSLPSSALLLRGRSTISWAPDSTTFVFASGFYPDLTQGHLTEPRQAALFIVDVTKDACTQKSVPVTYCPFQAATLGWSSPAVGLLMTAHQGVATGTQAISIFTKAGELVARLPVGGQRLRNVSQLHCCWSPSGATLCLADNTTAHLWHPITASLRYLYLPACQQGRFRNIFWSPCQQLLLLTHVLPGSVQLSMYRWQQPAAQPTGMQQLAGEQVLAWGLCGLLVFAGSRRSILGCQQLQLYHQDSLHFVLAHTFSLEFWERHPSQAWRTYAMLPDGSTLILPVLFDLKRRGLAIVDTRSGLLQCPPGLQNMRLLAAASDASRVVVGFVEPTQAKQLGRPCLLEFG